MRYSGLSGSSIHRTQEQGRELHTKGKLAEEPSFLVVFHLMMQLGVLIKGRPTIEINNIL